jgi:flavin-dependent dehydrogenase
VLVTSEGRVRVSAPSRRPPALAVYRGAGPRDRGGRVGHGLDAFLLDLVRQLGANVVPRRVTAVTWRDGRPEISVDGTPSRYDLIAAAIGVNLAPGALLEGLGLGSSVPKTVRVYATELRRGGADLRADAGSTMEIVLPDVAGVDAVGLVPKDGFSTMCVLGEDVDRRAIDATFQHPLMQDYGPIGTQLTEGVCHCAPRLNVREAPRPFRDRVVLVGDCGVTRLYKDGLGSAFRTARAAASTAVRRGVSADDFRRGYWPLYREIARDNRYGAVAFALLGRLRSSRPLLRASLRVFDDERRSLRGRRPINGILWDLFTGGASYRSILMRSCDPRLAVRVGARFLRPSAHRATDRTLASTDDAPRGLEAGAPGTTRGSPGAEHDEAELLHL